MAVTSRVCLEIELALQRGEPLNSFSACRDEDGRENVLKNAIYMLY